MKKYLLAIVSIFGVLAAAFTKGRQSGKATEETKSLEKDLQAEQKKSETLETVAEVRADVDALPSDDAANELRNKWSRD